MELAWTGFDSGSGDNPLNTSIRTKWRPEIARQFQEQSGIDADELFPVDDLFVMHKVPFRQGITPHREPGRRPRRGWNSPLPDRRVPDPYRGRRGVALPGRRLRRRMNQLGTFERLPIEEPFPGLRRRTFDGSGATVNEYCFEPGASFPLHRHPQEQITLVVDGTVETARRG